MNLESLVGQTLDDKYKIERELGRGGMGAVYLSTHVGTERPVAVKVIVPQFMQRAEFVERFRREARAAGRLRHPNVVDVTDFGFADTPGGRVAYLVMEYLDGCTLGEVLEEEKQLPLAWTLDILEQVSSAVHEAHGQGIIHRDLKPDNIWLEPNQRGGYTVKVLDFGIAKLEVAPNENFKAQYDHQIDISTPPDVRQTQSLRQNLTAADESRGQTISEQRGATVFNEKQTLTETNHAKTSFAEAGTLIQPPAVDLESGTAILPPAQTSTSKQASEAGTKLISEQVETDDNSRPAKSRTSDLTHIGAVLGTPLYMSPEQCRGEKLDSRSDIYSLGVIAYQMLEGQTPFGGDYLQVMQAHQENAPPELAVKKVPKKVKTVIKAALSKNLDERPSSAQAFINELRAHSEGFGVLVQRALVLYSEHLPKFLTLALLIHLPVAALTVLQIIVSVLAGTGAIGEITNVIFKGIFGAGAGLLGLFCNYLTLGTTAWLVAQMLAAPLRPVTLRPALSQVRKKWKSLAMTGIVSSILIGIGYGLCFLPGMYLLVIWSLVAPIIIMENLRGKAALKRSKALVSRSWRTATAAALTITFVPVLMAGLVTYLSSTVAESLNPPVVIEKNDKKDAPPAVLKDEAEEGIKISINGERISLNEMPAKKDMGKRLRKAVQEGLMQIVMLPFSILIASFFAIIVALLYLKTRQAGGESMQDLLSQFEESDQPDSNWQKRVRQRLIQSGKITGRGQSSSDGKRATES